MKWSIIGIGYVLGLFFLFFGTSANSPDVIYWNSEERLSWDDFEGKPRWEYNSISALTSSGIVHYKGCKDGKIIFKVKAYFEKKESWVKAEALTQHHLEHEQLHFDITELNARKLRKALAQREFKCGEELEFENFVNTIIQNWQLDQQAYDMMSRHSMNHEKQTEWFYRVAMELSLLEEYAE